MSTDRPVTISPPGHGELARRAAVVVVGVPLVVGLAAAGGWALASALGALAAGGALEVYRLSDRGGVRAFEAPGAVVAAALPLAAAVRPDAASAGPLLWALALLLLLAAAALAAWRRPRDTFPLEAAAVTVLGALYTGGTLSSAVLLRHLPSDDLAGRALLMFPVAAVWAGDTAAFLVGSRMGRRRLFPRVSPGKTVEGAVAGAAAAALAGAAIAHLVPALGLAPAAAFSAGGLLGVVGQVGDLAKSAWKREAGVRDSGALFPGHGGILDRMDSLFFALPAAYLLAVLAAY